MYFAVYERSATGSCVPLACVSLLVCNVLVSAALSKYATTLTPDQVRIAFFPELFAQSVVAVFGTSRAVDTNYSEYGDIAEVDNIRMFDRRLLRCKGPEGISSVQTRLE